MKLHIKYMVTVRCKMVVKAVLEQIGIKSSEVEIGYVTLDEAISAEQRGALKAALEECGLELVEDKKSILIEKIKSTIIDMVYHQTEPLKVNFSCYIAEKVNHDYTYTANVFSDVTGISIENYIIAHKIERVKELLMYDLSLTEISYQLNYSSVSHLSNQFKKVTGLTPSSFKNIQTVRKIQAA